MEAYYYSTMNKQQQAVYQLMKQGLTAINTSITVPWLEGRELQEIFFKLRLDCPEIFYMEGFRYRHYQDSGNVELLPEYLFDKKKIKEQQKAMRSRIAKVIRPAAGFTPFEKEKYIHDFICENVSYDKLKKQYSHEIIGPLGQGVGVCEGIAKTVKILCDELGIWCIIAISEANPEKGIKYRHAWNMIQSGQDYYHLDVTFDTNISNQGIIRYDYFNLDDKHIFLDHEPCLYHVPACKDGKRTYYREKNLSFTKIEDIVKRSAQAIRKGQTFCIHWRGGYLTKAVLTRLLECLDEAAMKRTKYTKITLNKSQSVLQLMFTDIAPEKKLTLETVGEEGAKTEETEE